MNTGDKNTKGRAILKGPRGGLYVIGPSGAKISTFKKATVAALPPPPPSAASPSNTFTHKGVKFTRVRNATAYGIPVYKKNGVDTYYTIPLTGSRLPSHMLLGTTINKAGCLDRCAGGPVAVVYPEGVWYSYVDTTDIDEIVESHLKNGQVVQRLVTPEHLGR